MGNRFLRIKETEFDAEDIINIDSISLINVESRTIMLNCVHGGRDGVMHVREEDIEKILRYISIIE